MGDHIEKDEAAAPERATEEGGQAHHRLDSLQLLPFRVGGGPAHHRAGQHRVQRQGRDHRGPGECAPAGQLRAGEPGRGGLHRRQPEAAGLGGRVAGAVPGARRRQPRADGRQHAAPERAAARRRSAAGGHGHGRRDGARFRRRDSGQAQRHCGLGGLRAHYRARRGRASSHAAFARGGIRHLPAHQVQAVEPEHLHQPEAGGARGRPRGEGPGDRRRAVHRAGRAGAGPQRAGGLHALARLQLRGRHPDQRTAGARGLLHLGAHRGVRDRGPRHQAGSRGDHARHSQRKRARAARPGRERRDPHRRADRARRHSGGQGHAQGRDAAYAGREAAARDLRRKGRRRARCFAHLPSGHRGHGGGRAHLQPQGPGEG